MITSKKLKNDLGIFKGMYEKFKTSTIKNGWMIRFYGVKSLDIDDLDHKMNHLPPYESLERIIEMKEDVLTIKMVDNGLKHGLKDFKTIEDMIREKAYFLWLENNSLTDFECWKRAEEHFHMLNTK